MSDIPAKHKAVQVVKMTTDIKEALAVNEVDTPTDVPAGHILIKVKYVGINATDMNSFLGRYGGGECPFTAGLEGLGEIVKAGAEVPADHFAVGKACLFSGLGAFAEYRLVPYQMCIPAPSLEPKLLTVPISALTAWIAVGEQARAQESDVALVTAAAGGTGQFAVQALKKKGCYVIGTCSSPEKVAFLKDLGCDRVINYREESIADVLKKEQPNGVDIVYESVGGDTFEAALDNLAQFGRLIIIGSITGYKDQSTFNRGDRPPLQSTLMGKCASMSGFMLPGYKSKMLPYIQEVLPGVATGAIRSEIDAVKFKGAEHVGDALAHLHSGKSFGKVVVEL